MFRQVLRGLAASLLAAALPTALSFAQTAELKKVSSVEGMTEYRLENGLRVILFPDPSKPKVTVNLTVLVGSRHEGYGEAGMAHLLEHMVFKGTPTHPDIPGAMKERGASFNGSTSVDRTNYYETLPASDENLEFGIKLEADRMVNSPIKAEDLATEFSVVRNEFESGENSPERILGQRMMAVAYEWHNYGKSTIGNRSDIERVPVDNLRDFYKRFYQPDNAILVIAGQFDEKKALGYIAKYFGALPKPDRKLPSTYTEEPAQDGERVVTLRRVGDVGLVSLLYHTPSGSHPDFPALEILSGILDNQPSGRLYKALVETKMASDVSAGAAPFHDPGVIEMTAEVSSKEPAKIEAVRDAMTQVIESIGKDGVTKEEVDRIRQKLLKNRELAAADPNQIAIRLSEWAAQGDWRLYFVLRDRLEKVTPEQVKDVAAKYLRPSNRTVGLFFPTTAPERTPIPASPEIATLVDGYTGRAVAAAAEAFDVAPLAIQQRVQYPTPIEGVKLALLPKRTRGEAVQVVVNLRYGDAQSLKGLVDASALLPELMVRGTAKLNRQQIQDMLDQNFARLGGSGGRGGLAGGGGVGLASFSIQTKRVNLPAVLEILRQIVREPSLPAEELELIKQAQLTQLEASKTDPTALGINQLQRTVSPYPKDDVRYVPTIEESIERLKAVSVAQIQTLYRDYLGASHGELSIVGDFEPSEVLPVLEQTFKGWASKKPYARVDRPYQPTEGGTQTIEVPDKANAAYFAGSAVRMNDHDPDYPAMVAGNFILGGGSLSSRIADRLRQKGGLSYTAQTVFNASPLDDRATLLMLAIYNPKNVDKVIEGVNDEVAKLLKDGVTPTELERATKGLLEQQTVQRSNDGALANILANYLFIGRTLQYDADFQKSLQALTPETVSAALRKYINPKTFAVITSGDFAQAGKTE